MRRDWPLIVAWPAIGLLSLIVAAFARMLAGRDIVSLGLLWSTLSWGEWALLVPFIMLATRRFPLRGERFVQHLAVHFAAALAVWLLHSVMVYLTTFAIYGRFTPEGLTLRQDVTWRLPVWLLYDVLVYLTTAAATAAIDFHRLLASKSSRQAQLQTRVAEAELELMQMQAQPEFILRTLAAARAYAVTEPRRCESLVSRLADVLRSSLDGLGSERASVDAELRHVRSWLGVDALRTNRRIELNIECDGDASEREIPRYLISGLVSSAVGSLPEDRAIAVTIEVVAIGDLFALRLRLEGEGISEAATSAIQRAEQRVMLYSTEEWSVQVEERSHAVIDVTFDQVRPSEEPMQAAGDTFEGGLFARA